MYCDLFYLNFKRRTLRIYHSRSYNEFENYVKLGLSHPPDTAYQEVDGYGDSVLGNCEDVIEWHLQLEAVQSALADEADTERPAKEISFCLSYDGSDGSDPPPSCAIALNTCNSDSQC